MTSQNQSIRIKAHYDQVWFHLFLNLLLCCSLKNFRLQALVGRVGADFQISSLADGRNRSMVNDSRLYAHERLKGSLQRPDLLSSHLFDFSASRFLFSTPELFWRPRVISDTFHRIFQWGLLYSLFATVSIHQSSIVTHAGQSFLIATKPLHYGYS
jgi:hypothetical protein